MVEAHQKKLEVFLHKIASERNYEDCEVDIRPISSGGANYSSFLFAGRISAPSKSDLKFFAKTAILAESIRSMMPSNVYAIEQYFYSTVAGIFKNMEDKYEIAEDQRLVIPEMYGYDATAPDEIIVLQDLAVEGYAIHDRFEPFNWEYAAAAMQQLARLHALSIALQHQNPKEYEEVKKKIVPNTDSFEAALTHMESFILKNAEIIKEENREAVQKYIKANYIKIMDRMKIPERQQMLIHGDYRTSNIMHKVEEGGKIHLIPVDYQTLTFGSPVVDLMYFIFTGSDSKFRRMNFHPLLDYYYDQLSLSLGRFELNAAQIYPKHEFEREITKYFGLGLIFALLGIPIMTVETTDAPALDSDMELDALMSMAPSQRASDRLNEVVDDYIQWGVLP